MNFVKKYYRKTVYYFAKRRERKLRLSFINRYLTKREIRKSFKKISEYNNKVRKEKLTGNLRDEIFNKISILTNQIGKLKARAKE